MGHDDIPNDPFGETEPATEQQASVPAESAEPAASNEPNLPTPPRSPRTPLDAFHMKELQPMSLSWHDLVFEVQTSKGVFSKSVPKQIIKGTSGHFKPGTLTALMGPSGAGKSTMMNVLAGRAPYGEIVNGKVVLNGKEAVPQVYQKQLAYVMQHDAMFATQTPREALHLTAALRLSEYSEEERTAIVDASIEALRLQKCADTKIGSVTIPGLSGGEKKRCAVAVELISSPSLIFLDEPTSGLDSQSAYELVVILRELARAGATIVCTIHQPSSEVFALFDDVMFLRYGQVMYYGPISGVTKHFETGEIRMKRKTNPADFAMQRLQTMDDEEAVVLNGKVQAVEAPNTTEQLTKADLKPNTHASPLVQLGHLVTREQRNMIRDVPTMIARFGSVLVLSLIISAVYYDAGSDWGVAGDRTNAVQTHFGAITFLSIITMFLAAQPMLLAFPLERATVVREYASGMYGTIVYLVAKTLMDIPAAVIQQLIGLIPFYFITAMNGNFGLFLVVLSLHAAVSSSIALCLGAATGAVETAINVLPALYVPQILFAGFFVASDDIPVWMRWLQYICPLKYTVNILTTVEFSNTHVPDDSQLEVDRLLDRLGVERGDWWIYVIVLSGLGVLCRVLACVLLTRRARSFA